MMSRFIDFKSEFYDLVAVFDGTISAPPDVFIVPYFSAVEMLQHHSDFSLFV